MSNPTYFGQSADLTLQQGQVGEIAVGWTYEDGSTKWVTKTVTASRPGRYVVYVYPPVSTDNNPTECIDATPGIFVVNITP